MIGGNRVRFGSIDTIKADLEWQRRMPTRERAVVTALSAPLLLRYGYIGRPSERRALTAEPV